MKIIFVRHGSADYTNDCLTEMGHLQAEAAAKRLSGEKIDKIYASSRGRAVETAHHIANVHGMEIELCDFMREINWGCLEDPSSRLSPWKVVGQMVEDGQSLLNPDWADAEPFSRDKIVSSVRKVSEGVDGWLAELEYERDGEFYRVRGDKYENVVMVCHAGSYSAVLSHIFNLPFPFVCKAMPPKNTSITVVKLSGQPGSLTSPSFVLLNDARHIADIEVENVFGR